MEGLREVYSAMFRLMKHRKLITQEEYETLIKSMTDFGYLPFIAAINNICKEGD